MSGAVEPLLYRGRRAESGRCPEQVFARAPRPVAAGRIEAADPAREGPSGRGPVVREHSRSRKSCRMLGCCVRERTGVHQRAQPVRAPHAVDGRDQRPPEVRRCRNAEGPRLRRLSALRGRNPPLCGCGGDGCGQLIVSAGSAETQAGGSRAPRRYQPSRPQAARLRPSTRTTPINHLKACFP